MIGIGLLAGLGLVAISLCCSLIVSLGNFAPDEPEFATFVAGNFESSESTIAARQTADAILDAQRARVLQTA